MMIRFAGCVIATVAGLAGGCPGIGSTQTVVGTVPPERGPVPPNQSCDLFRMFSGCPRVQCGTNSSVITGFAFGELNLDGCRNWHGTRLVPGSLRGGGCGSQPMKLELIDGELVGVGATGPAPRCRGDALAGATFWIEGRPRILGAPGTVISKLKPTTVVRRQLRIRAVHQTPPAVPDARQLPAYIVENTAVALALDDPSSTVPSDWYDVGEPQLIAAGARELCTHATSWLAGWPQPGTPDETPAPTVDQQALVVAGEVYNGKLDVFPTGTDAPRWFNLACAGSAVAKSRLMGYDPLATSSTPGERTATLKMLTAFYCDASHTEPGVPLYMLDREGELPEQPDPRIGPIEARWTADGASCLSHARLWRAGVPPRDPSMLDEAAFTAQIRQRCGIPVCTGPRHSDEHWETYTVDHIAHPAAPLSDPPPDRLAPPRP